MLTASAIVFALLSPVNAQISASASVGVHVPAPTIHFEVEPPLVVVTPGVYVVQDYDYEVFYVRGYYWCQMDGMWYRTRNYRGGWVSVNGPLVPRTIYRLPPGRYKHWKHGRPYVRGGHPGRPQRNVYVRGGHPGRARVV